LGKDSIEYNNTVKIDPVVHANIASFLKGKQPGDDMLDKINAQDLNDYLRGLMEGLTAKVFRTYNASTTLQNELNKKDLKGLTM
jgi:DNA topoisomerase-1